MVTGRIVAAQRFEPGSSSGRSAARIVAAQRFEPGSSSGRSAARIVAAPRSGHGRRRLA